MARISNSHPSRACPELAEWDRQGADNGSRGADRKGAVTGTRSVYLCLWLAVVFVLTALPLFAQAPTIQWIRQFGTSGDESTFSVFPVSNAVYSAGRTTGTLPGQTSAGAEDGFVRKYDANGNELWTRQFGTGADDYAASVAVDASGVYVAGFTRGTLPGQSSVGGVDAFVRKYDVNGNELWTRQFGSASHDDLFEVAVDATGAYVVGRTYGLPGQTYAGQLDAFVRKYDSNGNELWTRQFGSARDDGLEAVAVDATGLYVGGYIEGVLPGQTYAGAADAFVRKYDVNGNELWTRQFGTTREDGLSGVAVDATGLYVGGDTDGALPGQTYAGERDAFVRKYDANGNELWTRQFGTRVSDSARAVAADGTGVYVAGSSQDALPGQSSAGGGDAYVRKYDASGNELWTLQFGTSGNDNAYGVALDAGGVYAAGFVGGTFPGQTSAGGQDAYVVKLAEFIPVSIDIKPGSFPNSINLRSQGTVPVAILSTPAPNFFDATIVDPLSVTLAGAQVALRGKGTPMASVQDVNGDGLLDLVLHFRTQALNLTPSDTQAILTGQTFSGQTIQGSDSVRIVP